MGELLEKLNALDNGVRGPGEPVPSLADRAARAFSIGQPTGQRGDRGRPRARHALGHSQPLVAAGAVAGLGGWFLGWCVRRASAMITAVCDVVGAICRGRRP
jgi:hypothetical protein